MRAPLALVSCALLATLGLAACGGGGDSTAPSSPLPVNHAPAANAGSDLTVHHNGTVTLDGSGSTDSDGDALAYRWTQTSGTPVVLSSATSAKPSFAAPGQSGTLAFALVASDGKSDSPADTVSVTVENTPPKAAAANAMSAGPGTMAMLDGTASTDPDGDPLSYTWTQIAGPPVIITPIGPGVSQFQVPSAPVTLVFALTVSDGEATSVQINVTVNVIIVTPANQVPVAVAGADFVTPRRSLVTLYGYGYDPEYSPITFSWQQTAGPTVSLSDATSPYPSFTAPASPAELKFALTVSDGVLTSAPAEVKVDVQNFAPNLSGVAIAPNAPYTADNLAVDATADDPDNDTLTTTYEWRRNGTLVGQTGKTYPASLTTKNDIITAHVVVSDGLTETSADATTTILDSPAVLSANPPTALTYGATASFTITATDADGDAIPGFEVAYGPAGFAVTNGGAVTWTAAGALFDRVTDFNWGVRVRGDESSLLAGTIAVTDTARLYPVRRTGVQIPVQHSGLRIGDFDNDGHSEMLIGSSQAVYVLSKSGTTYQQSWVYPFEVGFSSDYNNEVRAVAAGNVTGDSKQEIFFAKGDTLVRLDGATRREAARRSVAGQQCRALELADIDKDGAVDLVCLAATEYYYYNDVGRIVVLNAITLAEKWESPELPLGYNLAVGNVDNDPALEIVTSGGYVFDGLSHDNQWAYSQPFGIAVGTGDMDGDGVAEIIGLVDWTAARAFDAVLKTPLWEQATPGYQDMDALVVADVDGDGRAEAIVGNGQWGEVSAIGYNTTSHQPEVEWHINSQNHGVTSIAVGDVDGDGKKDVVWGSGASSSGRDDLVIAGFTPTIAVEWKSSSEPQFDGGFNGGGLARIGGGATRLMFGTPRTNSGYDGARIIALNPATGEISFSDQIGTNWSGAFAFDIADFDLDNVDELFLGSANLYDGYFAAYDFNANALEWQSPAGAGTGTAVTHADLNADGNADLIGITAEGYLYAYDVHAQTLLWKSTGLGGGGIDVSVADLDNDGKGEIVAALTNRLVIYGKAASGTGYLERASVAAGSLQDLLVADLNGDGDPEISVLEASYSGPSTLTVYDDQLQVVRSVPIGVRASGVFLEDSAFARKNVLVSTSPSDYPQISPNEIWAVDPVSGAEVWHSPPLVGTVRPNSLQFVDVNGDGKKEITFATMFGMHYTR